MNNPNKKTLPNPTENALNKDPEEVDNIEAVSTDNVEEARERLDYSSLSKNLQLNLMLK